MALHNENIEKSDESDFRCSHAGYYGHDGDKVEAKCTNKGVYYVKIGKCGCGQHFAGLLLACEEHIAGLLKEYENEELEITPLDYDPRGALDSALREWAPKYGS